MSLNFQGLQGESKELMERLEENIVLLVRGWRERVEYVVPVRYHVKGDCTASIRASHDGVCDCPVKDEKRARYVAVPGLIDQLQNYVKNKDVDRNPQAARQAPRVKKVKYMPELNGFFTLDEITCDAISKIDRAYEEGGRDRMLAANGTIHEIIGSLTYQMGQVVDSRPDIVREMVKASRTWVETAKRTLNLTVSDAQFAGTVCGNCGGGLAIAWDNTGDVKCIGTPTLPSCGHTYPMSEWVELYEKGRK